YLSVTTTRPRSQEKWEREVRSASSLDELLRLTDFPDWKLWKCRSHRSTRYASEWYSLDILKAIDEEWQRTQCMPRETCIDVAKELGTDPSMFFKPPCVSVHRCNGCCNQEGVTCKNTSTTYVNKTLLSVVPSKFRPEPVLIKVANHTECRCMEPAIIRRNARPHGRTWRLCASGLIWDCMSERCIPYPSSKPGVYYSVCVCLCESTLDRGRRCLLQYLFLQHFAMIVS
uniref:Vascular endothelial growth factor D n=1 Tax=Myripristis murdjan TaxID=586833 RepID=A0A667XIA7_9TELE